MQKKEHKQDAERAIFHLRLIQHGTHLVEIYQKLFPDHFATHGIDYRSAESVMDCYDMLCMLIDERLFPCIPYGDNWWIWEDMESSSGVEYALATIPVFYRSRNWVDRWAEHLTILEKVILTVTGTAMKLGDDLPTPRAGAKFSLDRLKELCEVSRGARILDLPAVVEAVTGSTGNPWVDMSDEDFAQCELPEWNLKGINYIAEDHAVARQIWEKVDRFEKWVNASQSRMETVKRLLLESCVDARNERVRVSAGRPLVETLGGVL